MKLWIKYKTLLDKYEVNTPLRLAYLFSQLEHESGLEPKQENLNYTARRLLQVFPKYFKDVNEASKFYGQPQAIANRVYGNRMGNGPETSGDGYKYRGRGYIQLTGKDNYKRLSEDTDIDFITNPDILLEEANSMVAALWFWKTHNLNELADNNEITLMTRKINGGVNGLYNRILLLHKYKEIFKNENDSTNT